MSILSKILVTLLCSCKSAEATAELKKIIRHFRDAATEAADEVDDEIKPIVRSSRTSSRGSKRRYAMNQLIYESIFLNVKFMLGKKTWYQMRHEAWYHNCWQDLFKRKFAIQFWVQNWVKSFFQYQLFLTLKYFLFFNHQIFLQRGSHQ